MAVNLKLKKKCHIVAPDWLNIGEDSPAYLLSDSYAGTEFLQERLNLEVSQPAFSGLPFRFAEMAKVILDV